MRSGFLLAKGERLTAADVIARLDLSGARLAALSACETGRTDIRQAPDEYLGLPAGFLRAGAAAVVSTLWAVNDLSTMLLMERFYRYHLENGLPPDVALCKAQRWLRDVTKGELRELFGRYRDAAPDGPRMPFAVAEKWFTHYTLGDPTARPFEHPYHWGAFVVSGI
jgi:CHAT domain-containing protein